MKPAKTNGSREWGWRRRCVAEIVDKDGVVVKRIYLHATKGYRVERA